MARALDAGGRRDQRRSRPARRAARAPELPPRLLAHRRPGARLPALLRHQHPGRPAHGGRAGLRRHPRPGARAGCGRACSTASASTIRTACATRRSTSSGCATRPRRPGSWSRRSSSRASRCRESWPVDGTTGYDFLNRVGGLFVDPAGEEPLTDLYAELHRRDAPTAPALVRGEEAAGPRRAAGERRQPAGRGLPGGLRAPPPPPRLHPLRAAPGARARWSPASRSTAPTCGRSIGEVSELRPAATSTRRSRPPRRSAPTSTADLFDFLRDCSCCCEVRGEPESELVMRFQQLTGPVMAKGVEDTAFYNFHRLIALNEVGGEPGRVRRLASRSSTASPPRPSGAGRRRCSPPRRTTPSAARTCGRGSACSPRSPSAGARPSRRWFERNARHRREADCPDRNAEYLLYQTLVGAWPIYAGARGGLHGEGHPRGQGAHLLDAARTPEYEEALRGFVERRARRSGVRRRPRSLRGPAGRAGADQLARPDAAQAHRPGRARLLPGHGALGPLAWSIPTTAGRSTTSCGAACSPS